jgi:hypothetical protein
MKLHTTTLVAFLLLGAEGAAVAQSADDEASSARVFWR